MYTFKIQDANSIVKFLKVTGKGTSDDPHVLVVGSDGEGISSDIISIGGMDVPVIGVTPAIPSIIVDKEGEQITSFGSPSYRGEYNSPVDFTAEYLSSNTLSIAALMGFTIQNDSQIAGVKVIHADKSSDIFANGSGGMTLTHSAGVITLTGATPFVVGDVYEVGINAQKKAYSDGQNLDFVTNPEWKHYTSVEHPVDELNVTPIAPIYTIIDMEGFRSAALQLMGINTTFTAYITLSDNATDTNEADTQWVDATLDLFGSATVATGATSESSISFIETLRMPKKIMIKSLPTVDADNSVDVWVRRY